MRLMRFRVKRSVVIVLLVATSLVLFSAARCDAQWGYRGRGAAPPRGGIQYRGLFLSFDIAPPYASAFDAPVLPPSAYADAYGSSPYGASIGGSTFDRYRGMQPTQAELDRERFYYELDRTHRFQTREERYGNDFAARYTPPAAMVDRYRYPYVAGMAAPRMPQPVPGVSTGRYQSRYQGYIADDDVAVALRAAAVRLQLSLARMADGHIWIRHLKPDQIIDSIDRTESPGLLTDLIVNYEGVAENPRLILVAASEGFSDVRRLLAQYVMLPSTYPSATPMEQNGWSTDPSVGEETILSERVIGEEVIAPSTTIQSQPTLAPPLPVQGETIDDVMELDRPSLDSLPDQADVELLPAPAPTPAE